MNLPDLTLIHVSKQKSDLIFRFRISSKKINSYKKQTHYTCNMVSSTWHVWCIKHIFQFFTEFNWSDMHNFLLLLQTMMIFTVVVVFVLNFFTELIFKALFISSMNEGEKQTHSHTYIHTSIAQTNSYEFTHYTHTHIESKWVCLRETVRHSRTRNV